MGEALAAPLADLSENAVRLSRDREKRYGYLSEAATALVMHLASLGEGESPAALYAAAAADLPALPPGDAVDFSALFLRAVEGQVGRPLTLLDLPDGARVPPGRHRIVYVESPISADACARFAALFTDAVCHTRMTLRELCDDVENGYAEYAILPLFADGAAIPSVTALLEERGLAIAATVRCPVREGEIVYGLLSASPVLLFPPTHFFLRYRAEGETGASPVLAALAEFPLAVEYLDTLPSSYDGAVFRILVRGEEGTFLQLLSYLLLYVPTFMGYGFYTELTGKELL
ncbi:MAG: hypothetical protein J6T24_01095 [Clostridia bacterium]|nr:hypothetical protein [Clostridia bacterium]